ncbi:MAG: cytochrome C [Nitrospirae bacterium]|nr:MAG: cytochrome C [Nitrospirota bacterium]
MKSITLFLLLQGLALVQPSGAEADEVTYTTRIKQIVDAQCIGCHGADSPEYHEFKANMRKYEQSSKGPRMDSYTYLIYFIGWPDSGAIMRRLDDGKNTKEGRPGNMFKYLGSTEEERQKNLSLFREWVGNWTLKRWADITKEEMTGIKVAY